MERVQISIDADTREKLRWAKALSGSDGYDELLLFLLDQWDVDVPERELTGDAWREHVTGRLSA